MICVTGGMGYVGSFLLDKLVGKQESVCCLVRPGKPSSVLDALRAKGIEVIEGDLSQTGEYTRVLGSSRIIIHLAHIRYAPQILQHAGPATERIVLISSLWRFSRVPSPVVNEIIAAEDIVEQSDKPWVLLRPSMIYGPRDDRNISRLAGHLRRWRVLPIFGDGRRLQQPVYVEDVVAAVLASIEKRSIEHRAYALAGRFPLSYRELIDAVGRSVGVVPHVVALPVQLSIALLNFLKWCRIPSRLEPEQILRLQEDKSYSIEDAGRDLDFVPLEFERGLDRLGNWKRGGRED